MDELIQRIDGHFQDIHVSQRQSIREVEGLKEVVGDTQSHITGMQAQIAIMQTSITKLQSEMVELQTDLRRMHVRVDGLHVSMVNIDTAIVELRGTFASLGVMLKEHAGRISDLEDKQAS